MSDEVDDLLRRTMTTLDRQVPDGYFDTLVSRTLVRLDDAALGEPLDPRDAPAAPAIEQAAPMPGRRARLNRRSIAAVVGLGLAAAAGAMIVVGVRDKTASAPKAAGGSAQAEPPATSAPAGAQPPAAPSQNMAAGSAVVAPATAGSAARDQILQADQGTGDGSQAGRPVAPAVEQDAAVGKVGKQPIAIKGRGKAAPTDEPTKFKIRPSQDAPSGGKFGTPFVGKKGPRQDGERPVGKPSKQGVPVSNGAKPAADASSLSSDDIKRGMAAVAAQAKACFTGTEGTARVQLTVAPSGQVQKVTVTGPFAGTPTGTCVEQAVRAATFPAWDGEPESVGYDYLISH